MQVQRHAKVDQLLRPELGEEKGARQVEKLPYMPGVFLTWYRLFFVECGAELFRLKHSVPVAAERRFAATYCVKHAAPVWIRGRLVKAQRVVVVYVVM